MGALMTVQDLANYLNLSKPTIYLWAKEGVIPIIKINGKRTLRFDKDDVDKVLKAHSTALNNYKVENNSLQ